MRVLSIFAFLFCIAFAVNAQELSDKTIVKTLNPEEASSVVINFKAAQINPQPWDGMAFRIELLVKANMPTQVLEQLVKAGRYNLDGYKDGDNYFVTAPNIEKNVSVRGKDLEEEIIVLIKTPGYYELANNTLSKDATSIAARGANEGQISEYLKIKSMLEIPEITIKSTLKGNPELKLNTGDILIDGTAITIE
jgi:hypothetical protein